MTLKRPTDSPMNRFAAMAQRTRPRRTSRTGARYSPPPTPVKPDRRPIGRLKRPPMANPSRRSASKPDAALKASGERPAVLLPFRGVRRRSIGTWEVPNRPAHRPRSGGPLDAHGTNAPSVHRDQAAISSRLLLRPEQDMDVRTFRLDLFHGDPVRLAVGEQGPRHRADAARFFARLVPEDRIRGDQVQGIHHPYAGDGIVEFANDRRG